MDMGENLSPGMIALLFLAIIFTIGCSSLGHFYLARNIEKRYHRRLRELAMSITTVSVLMMAYVIFEVILCSLIQIKSEEPGLGWFTLIFCVIACISTCSIFFYFFKLDKPDLEDIDEQDHRSIAKAVLKNESSIKERSQSFHAALHGRRISRLALALNLLFLARILVFCFTCVLASDQAGSVPF